MNATLFASLAAMFTAFATFGIAMNHWYRTYSSQRMEIERLGRSRKRLAEKFVRQLGQARLYSRLEDEFCKRLAEHTPPAAETHKKTVRRYVEEQLGDGTLHRGKYTKESGIQAQLESVREMGFQIDGETVIETQPFDSRRHARTAA
jgi:ribosomal protein L18